MAGFLRAVLTCKLLAFTFVIAVGGDSVIKRSDDSEPVLAIVDRLAQRVTLLEAKLQATINDCAARDRSVGFTVRTSHEDMTHLGLMQTIKFDNVVFNAGNGYDPVTGTFTAPIAGTYYFFLQVMLHNFDELRVYLDIMKNGQLLARAHAGYVAYENGSSAVVTYLHAGDRINVQISEGTKFWGELYTTFAGFLVSPN